MCSFNKLKLEDVSRHSEKKGSWDEKVGLSEAQWELEQKEHIPETKMPNADTAICCRNAFHVKCGSFILNGNKRELSLHADNEAYVLKAPIGMAASWCDLGKQRGTAYLKNCVHFPCWPPRSKGETCIFKQKPNQCAKVFSKRAKGADSC